MLTFNASLHSPTRGGVRFLSVTRMRRNASVECQRGIHHNPRVPHTCRDERGDRYHSSNGWGR